MTSTFECSKKWGDYRNTLGSLGFFLQDKQKYTVDNIDVLSESNASRAIRTLDAGMKQLGVQRSQIGAQANSLEARGRSLSTSHENLSAARARIRDADIASESARMVRVQIMQQASASILSQAREGANKSYGTRAFTGNPLILND
ncbi:flagellin [Aeromonas caviae]|uniref:flagellin n=1 Tax=Aeromonas caviae TaxID=648 RepID=UPI00398CBCB8